MMNWLGKIALGACMAACASSPLAAATISAGVNSGFAGTTVTIPVTYVRSAGDAFGVYSATFRILHNNPPITFVSFALGTAPTAASVTCNANGANTQTTCVVFTNPPTPIAVGSYTLGTITYQISPTAAVGAQALTTTIVECTDVNGDPINGACTPANGNITVIASALGPSLAYSPTAGASAGTGGPVGFTGVTTVGTVGSGQIAVTPSGGAASGTTTLGSFVLSGANQANFAVTSAATLTFTAGVPTVQNITLTCTSGAAGRTANLQATETINGGATSQRFWVLNCPAGSALPLGPSLAYSPTAGASAGTGGPVGFTGVTTVGTVGSGQIAVTPSGGAASGTTTLGSFVLSGANQANFAVTSAATLTFTAGVPTVQNITLTCTSGAAGRTANLQATETINGGATSQRFWVLNCPAGSALPLGPSLAYSPTAGASVGTGGPVGFTGVTLFGTVGSGQIAVTPSGGAASGTTTLSNFALSGANSVNFAVTSAATLTFTTGVPTVQNITLTCTSGIGARTANLNVTETVTGGATTQRFWVLDCPAGSLQDIFSDGFDSSMFKDGFEVGE